MGDEEQCRAAITRVDFDLGNSGFKLEPTSVFMGSTAQDTDKDSVNRQCKPRRHMGELCSLITQPGIIDCIRYTPFLKMTQQLSQHTMGKLILDPLWVVKSLY